jgi:ABC-type sugar transport system substrate-binding protein
MQGLSEHRRGKMKNIFVVQTDDENFKEVITKFLTKHCKTKDVKAAVYEMNHTGSEQVMQVVKNV